MQPINTSSAQQTQSTQQPVTNASKDVDLALRVAGVALATLAVGAILLQLPGDLVVAGVILVGFAALTCFCIATVAYSSGNSIIYTPSYRPRPLLFFRPDDSVYYRRPIVLPPRMTTIPSYRPAPMPAPGIDPRPMREPVGIRRR